MKHLLLGLFLTGSALAQDLTPIASPDLKSPLPQEWLVKHGTWDIQDGVMTITELPENKHAAVLWHQIPLQKGVVECEFLFNGGKSLLLGCDGDKHIGRVVISPQAVRISDDSTEVKGKTPATILATGQLDLKSGEWYKLHYEWNGERMAATVNDVHVEGSAPSLAATKSRWWIAVAGASIKIRNLKVMEAKP